MNVARAGTDLDEHLRVVQQGSVVCCIGLRVAFYFQHRDEQSNRERAIRTFERYRAEVGAHLVWGADPKTGSPRKVAGTPILDLRARSLRMASDDSLDFVAHGGKAKKDADPHTVVALVRPDDRQHSSYVTLSLPFSWVTDQEPGAFVRLVVELSDILGPSHGHAGLAAIPYVGVRQGSPELKWLLGLLARFSGLQFDLPSHDRYFLDRDKCIKGVDWLTILEKSWIEQLGGETRLRSSLGQGIGWLPTQSGVVIQAGDRPLFGDINVQEPMTPYEQVARGLKPIRATTIGAISSTFGFDEVRTDKWLARFD